MDIDLDNLTTVKKSSVQKQNYDLRYSHAGERFTVSDRFYANKGLNNNGFTFHLANNGKVPLISIRPNEESVFYKGKAGDADKGTAFQYGILETGLRDLDMLTEGDDAKYDDFKLEFVKEKEGADYYVVKPADEIEEEAPAEEEAEEEDASEDNSAEEETAENAPEDDGEEEEDDPFDL